MPDPLLRALWRHPDFARGARDMAALSLGLAAWGLVTGVAMAQSGLALPLCLLMTFMVFAGSAQLAALPLITSNEPLWTVWALAFFVNLRFVIFSAQWRPYFAHLPRWQRLLRAYFAADLNFVIFMSRYPRRQPEAGQGPYFWGAVAVNWPAWQVPCVLGVLLANVIPTQWGFGFAGILALLGLLCTLLTDLPSRVAAAVAAAAAVATVALPMKLNMVVAIAAAVSTGLMMDSVRTAPPPRMADRT